VPGASIEQGDLLQGFDVLVPLAAASDTDEIEVEWHRFNLVVMTQTCDIEHGKVRSLLLCPWWDLWDFIDAATAKGENWGREVRENLRRGNIPGYHLLNEADQGGIGIGLVDFHEVYSAPTPRVREFLKGRRHHLRLCPPYREHLAQAFARFFMRVGLPVDIPPDRIRRRDA
jgi:hypothetical protein